MSGAEARRLLLPRVRWSPRRRQSSSARGTLRVEGQRHRQMNFCARKLVCPSRPMTK